MFVAVNICRISFPIPDIYYFPLFILSFFILQVHIVQRGAVRPLIEMLQSPDVQLKEMSAFALGRLAQVLVSNICCLQFIKLKHSYLAL